MFDNKIKDINVKKRHFDFTRQVVVGSEEEIGLTIKFEKKKSSDLWSYLSDLVNSEEWYNERPNISASEFIPYMPTIRSWVDKEYDIDGIEEFVDFIDTEFKDYFTKMKNMINEGKISFQAISHYFKQGDKVYYLDDHKQYIGAEITGIKLRSSYFGKFWSISYDQVTSNGHYWIVQDKSFSVNDFEGVCNIDEFELKHMTAEIEEQLQRRGEIFNDLAFKSTYLYNDGNMFKRGWFGDIEIKANGRVMIDNHNFGKMNPNSREDRGNNVSRENFDPKNLFKTVPYIKGFSFVSKKWGLFSINKLSEIDFRENAFDDLVLEEGRKKLVKALVTNSSDSFSDIIDGKGGGCIFLLHGPPGTGKTLTSESIAEVLKKPLYSVSVGELGTTPEHLEESLREILDMALEWDAVILIDEADIFLEARDENDIHRNAMVGIFLRLLEYHQGVMFLTTNRVKTFDEAFYSRISVSLEYPEHNSGSRYRIWNNLLNAAGIEMSDEDKRILSERELNGRQIKNVIRLSQSLAKDEGLTLNLEHFLGTIEITGQFQQDQINKMKDKE